jgi:Flp pilus assembly protein TadD
MPRVCWVAGLAACLFGCANDVQERVREYNQDGLVLYQRGDFRGARETFEVALKLQPEDPALLYNLGQCYERLGDVARAESTYGECLTRQPTHAVCRHALVRLLVRQGRSADATRMVEDWLAREPKSSGPYAADGWLWHQSGDLPRAQARLQQALELDPRDVYALGELGVVYEAMDRPDRALVLYERALEQDPNRPEVVRRYNDLKRRGAGPPKPD